MIKEFLVYVRYFGTCLPVNVSYADFRYFIHQLKVDFGEDNVVSEIVVDDEFFIGAEVTEYRLKGFDKHFPCDCILVGQMVLYDSVDKIPDDVKCVFCNQCYEDD